MADEQLTERAVLIYGLIDPLTNELKYIGKTHSTLRRRLLGHLNDVKRGRVYIPRHKWIAGLLLLDTQPEIFAIEEVKESAWRDAEQFWISYFRFIGCQLLNATDGGDGLCSYKHREDTKARQSESAKRRYENSAERKKTGDAVREAFKGAEAKANFLRGRSKVGWQRPAHLIAFVQSPEGRERLGNRMRGVPKSAEHRAKLSAAKLGKKMSPEAIANIAKGHIGLKHTPETVARRTASLREFFRKRRNATMEQLIQ